MPRALRDDEVQAFRASLCEVAERLFAEQGYEGVTLRALATELGCSPMTPYRYFANKEAIFAAVRTAAFARFGAAIERAAAAPATPLERLRHLGRAYVAFAMREQSAYRIMFEVARPAGLDADALADADQRATLLRGWLPLVETIEALAKQGAVDGEPLLLAHVAFSALHGLVMLELSDKYLLGVSFEELVEPAIDRLIRGLLRGPDALPEAPPSGGSP